MAFPVRRSRRPLVLLATFVLTSFPPEARAQFAYETVHDFVRGPGVVMGNLVQAFDGNLYGVTSEGGAYSGGTVFVVRRTATGWAPAVTLHNFRAGEGIRPLGGLLQGTPGVLYGTTSTGGGRGGGTVFRINIFGAFVVLASLDPAVHGHGSIAELVRGFDGQYYGTAEQGGRFGRGTVFRVSPTGTLTTLHSFTGAEGSSPRAALALALDGRLYGTTAFGGAHNRGTIFRVSTTGVHTLLHSFSGVLARPNSRLTAAADGAFYGTTQFFAGTTDPNRSGVFRLSASGEFQEVHTFFYGATNSGVVRAQDGALYGATTGPFGIFRVRPGTPGVEWLVEPAGIFTDVGDGVRGLLVAANDGKLYGATFEGALGGLGAVWSVDLAGEVRAIHTFRSEGYHPAGTLMAAGALHGTTYAGGAAGKGTLFARHPGSTMETIAHFTTDHGIGDVVLGPVGILARTVNQLVEVYETGEMTPRGEPGISCTPLRLNSGIYWGSVSAVFRWTGLGDDIQVIHVFTENGNPAPVVVSGLAEGPDGLLYGTTAGGGAFGHGTIFRMAPDGTGFITLHDFALTDGARPTGTLLRHEDALYGTTLLGGDLTQSADGLGTVFRITPQSEFTMLHAFGPGEGAFPYAGLVSYFDVLFGTTLAGGRGTGTVYSITANGTFETVHEFLPGQGATPVGGLTAWFDGALYGTTFAGGTGNVGVIYRLRLVTP